MKNMFQLSNYLFAWYWKKWGKMITFGSLILGGLVLFYLGFPYGNGDSYEYFPKSFQTYDMVIDRSFLPMIFILGLLFILVTLFLQIKGFSNNGKGIYTLFTLPLEKKEVYFSFACFIMAVFAIYYILWLLFFVLAYIPITISYEHKAAKEILYLAEGLTLTDLDTHLQNGLFLAFQRSLFLSTFFPSSLWMVPSFIAAILLWFTAILFGSLCTKKFWNCTIVSGMSFLGGCYLLLCTSIHRFHSVSNTLFLGRSIVLGVIGLFAVYVVQAYLIGTLEEHLHV